MQLLGRCKQNACLLPIIKLIGNTQTMLYKINEYDHAGMPMPAFPLLIKKVTATKKVIGAGKQPLFI